MELIFLANGRKQDKHLNRQGTRRFGCVNNIKFAINANKLSIVSSIINQN